MMIEIRTDFSPVLSQDGKYFVYGKENQDNRDVIIVISTEALEDMVVPHDGAIDYLDAIDSNTFSILAIADLKLEEILELGVVSEPIKIDVTSADVANYNQ